MLVQRDGLSKPKPTICMSLGSHAVTEGRCPSCRWLLLPDVGMPVIESKAGLPIGMMEPFLSQGPATRSGRPGKPGRPHPEQCSKGHRDQWTAWVGAWGDYRWRCLACRRKNDAAYDAKRNRDPVRQEYLRTKARARYVPKPRPLQTHCHRGHEFTPENTRITSGRRNCRACNAINCRERRARQP